MPKKPNLQKIKQTERILHIYNSFKPIVKTLIQSLINTRWESS